MESIKRVTIIVLLVTGISTGASAQKIDFSAYLAPSGGVHTATSSVVDKSGNIFVSGGTREGLKVTDDAFQKNYKGCTADDVTGGDAFLIKLSPQGDLLYSTYIGGTGSENYCLKLTLDDSGNVYVGFTTDSRDLPVSKNAYQKSIKGESDHFIIKFSNDCRYIASTYLGGSDGDHWTSLEVNNNLLYLFGKTTSKDFPVTKNAFQKEYDNSYIPEANQSWMSGDITITSLSLNLDKIISSTYLGGKSLDYVRSYTFNKNGKILLAGATYSDNFPTTANSYQNKLKGVQDGFFTVLDKNLLKLEYSTYFGGDSTDQMNAVLIDDKESVILAGETKSPDFPVTADAMTGKYAGGNTDGFLMKFNIKLNKPIYSTFIGGSRTDNLRYIAKTNQNTYLFVGLSASKNFPITKDALYPTIAGGLDLFILVLDKTLKNIEYSTFGGGVKQRVMDPCVTYSKEGKLIIASMCVSPDFPATIKFANPDDTWTNSIWKFDMNRSHQ